MTQYFKPTEEAARALVQRAIKGPFVVLNLLRFRKVADYSAHPDLAPPEPISGAEAYERYIGHTLPFLKKSGGDLLFLGKGGPYLIGPDDEYWDLAMLIQQKSVESFFAFASHKAYLAGLGHRTAALQDSRLLPLADCRHNY